MGEERRDKKKDLTGPPGRKTHEATTPPGQGELDRAALESGRARLDQAAGAH